MLFMSSAAILPAARLAALMRDLATGFHQQMFFWGRDAVHPMGNLFQRCGFEKRRSTGLQGTSCYSLPWQNGVIELHGSHAGWFGQGGGFLFVRPMQRCVRWLEEAPPIPGSWPTDCYDSSADERMHAMALPFLDWWLEHEQQVIRIAGERYRQQCHRQFKKLPKSRAWLTPDDALQWISGLRNSPENLARANSHRKARA